MRASRILPLAAFAVLAFTASASAQTRPKVTIDNIAIGLPSAHDPDDLPEGGPPSYYKAGLWTPVYVSISPGPEGISSGRIVVETTDIDYVQNTYTVPLPQGGLPPNESYTAIAYVKPASATGLLDITVYADDRSVAQKYQFATIAAHDVLYLGIGSRLPGLKRLFFDAMQKQNVSGPRGYCSFVEHDVHQLPDRWFGYESVDVAVLTTGRRDFVSELLNEREHRKEALAEWVRRGGRLVISCGHNQDMLPELLSRLQIDFPVTSTKPMHARSVTGWQNWLGSVPPLTGGVGALGGAAGQIDLAQLEAKPGSHALEVIAPDHSEGSPLLVVRAPHGLGQVILVAFDLDSAPFASWKGQARFWEGLQAKTQTRLPSASLIQQQPYGGPAFGYPGRFQGQDLLTRLNQDLDKFPSVSVVSFGWVALFILIYIIIVGPLDYLFLKKVVGRLELTWITFPTVVLAVSAAAYFAAYYLKGSDLRINKMDVVDIDVQGNRCYGTSWFTIFSPRIQLYTIGLEPALPSAEKSEPSVVVSWVGKAEDGFGGVQQPHSQGLFQRTYEFDADARGLKSVPIQVWTSKSFSATWEQLGAVNKPLFSVELRRRESGANIEGRITSHLPVTLEDAVLIVSDFKVLPLGTLEPGKPVNVVSTTNTTAMSSWLQVGSFDRLSQPNDPTVHQMRVDSSTVKHIMFGGNSVENTLARYLDQDWRRTLRNQAILVGAVAAEQADAEKLNNGTDVLSRLWLGAIPGQARSRPALMGTLWEKSYVRAYLPVQAAPKSETEAER
jgi:hypothetical protein